MIATADALGLDSVFNAHRGDNAARRKVLDYLRERLDENPNAAMVQGMYLGDLDLETD